MTEAQTNAILTAIVEKAPLLEDALKYSGGTDTVVDIARGVLEGKYQLWTAPNSVGVTQVVQHPQLKECHVFLIAGKLAEVERVRPAIEDWAKKQGCSRILGYGRRGWERVMERAGYKFQSVILAKELSDGKQEQAD